MFSSFSYRVLFQRFFPQNISLLPKIVTEAHANLKKKKTSCNTTLKHYAVMVKYTPLDRSSLISSLICQPVAFFFHLFIINSSSKFIWVVVFTAQCTFSPGALSFYELKEGRVHALVHLVSFGIETINTTCMSYIPVVPSKTIPDSRPKWTKSIPIFKPKWHKKPYPLGRHIPIRLM